MAASEDAASIAPTSARHFRVSAVIGLLGLFVTAVVFEQVSSHHDDQFAAEFEREVERRVATLDQGIAQAVERLRSVAAFFLSSDAVNAQEFRDFTASYLRQRDGVALIGWAAVEFADEEAGLATNSMTAGAMLRLRYLEPGPVGAITFDFDLASHPELMPAVDAAFAQGSIQFVPTTQGLLLVTPTLDQVDWSGVAIALLPPEAIAHWAGIDDWSGALAIAEARSGKPLILKEWRAATGQTYETRFEVDGTDWIVRATPLAGPPIATGAWGTLAAGVVITGLLVFLVLTLAGSADRANELVRQRTRELAQAESEARAQAVRLADEVSHNTQLISSIPSLLIGVDAGGVVSEWNRAVARLSGIPAASATGRPLRELGWQGDLTRLCEGVEACMSEHEPRRENDLRFTNAEGRECVLGVTCTPFKDSEDTLDGCLIFGADVTERNAMEVQLREAQRLEAVGRLAAGIAHEVNTPAQFVSDNTSFLKDAFGDLLSLEDEYSAVFDAVSASLSEAQRNAVQQARETADREYLLEEVPQALEQSMDGIRRIADIVRAMKEFSHPGGGGEKEQVDFNRLIRNAITVAANEWKYHASVETDLDDALPPVPCYPRELNQVVLNLLINAAHAIADRKGESGERGVIRITTAAVGNSVQMRVRDTGTGIPAEVRDKIFEPFFTTKEVGRGSGQGLALAYTAVVEQHEGELTFETEIGIGTVFSVSLPLQPQEAEA